MTSWKKGLAGLSLATAACSSSIPPSGGFPAATAGVKLIGDISVPNATRTFAFDGSQVYNGKYYLADRNAPGLTVVDVASLQVTSQVADTNAFPGQAIDTRTGGLRNDLSGPNGLAVVTSGAGAGLVYLGSNMAVVVVDPAQNKVVASNPNLAPIANPNPNGPQFILAAAPDGNRADGGCYDPKHRLMMFQHPDESPTYVSFHDVDTRKVFAVLPMPDNSLGLEGCVYDAANDKLILVNDGTNTNGTGELDVLDPALIAAAKGPTVTILDPGNVIVAAFNIPCNGVGGQGPLGIDINTTPGSSDAIVGCDPPFQANPSIGNQQVTVIMDRTIKGKGAVKAVLPFGGSDQVAYDQTSNRYFVATRRYTSNGIAQTNAPAGTVFSVPVTPVLGVVDANPPYTILALYPSGGNSHSVAVDGPSGKVFVPYAPGVAAFPGAGISVYSAR